MARSLSRPHSGMSLLEVVLAVILMNFVVVGVLMVLSGGLRLLNQAADVERASQLAKLEIENIRQSAYAYTPDGTYFDARRGDASNQGFPPPPYSAAPEQTYKLAIAVNRINPNLRSVSVEVFWGEQHAIHLETLMNP